MRVQEAREPDRAQQSAVREPESRSQLSGTAQSLAAQLQHATGNAALTAQLRPLDAPAVQRSSVQSVLATSGRPLDAQLRTEMEARLGADFSTVRVHDGAAAQRSAADVGARAYTSGEHIVIGQGGASRHTLAHELTHVIQQRSGPVSGTENGEGLRISDPADRFEREAEANATRAMSAPLAPQLQALQRTAGNTAVHQLLRSREGS